MSTCQVLERGAWAGPGSYTKVSCTTPRVLGPNSKKLINQLTVKPYFWIPPNYIDQ